MGLIGAAARMMGDIARGLERHLLRAHPLEIARRQREAEQRHAEMEAKADAADRAALNREFEQQQEEYGGGWRRSLRPFAAAPGRELFGMLQSA